MTKELSYKQKLFCFYLIETNNRIKAIEKSGYCTNIVDNAKELDREYTVKEKICMRNSANRLVNNVEVKKELERLKEEKEMYLQEIGVSSIDDILKWLSDVMNGKKSKENAFILQQEVVAAKELLNYYDRLNKIGVKKGEEKINLSRNAKTFIVEYLGEKEGSNNNEIKGD